MATNETTIITETTTDETGTTVTEVTTIRTEDASSVTDGQTSIVEEVIEAILDDNPDAVAYPAEEYAVVEAETDATETDATELDAELDAETNVIEPTLDDFASADSAAFAPVAPVAEGSSFVVADAGADAASASAGLSADAVTGAAEGEETNAHAEAATAAQQSADEFIAEGDYAAAAEAREVAENESWEAGDDSMLTLTDSSDLTTAATQQETAQQYEQQEAAHAAAGDYEAAREDAGNAAYATGNADWNAGGADHTGQADAEHTQMDWAVWEQDIAEGDAQSAVAYAAEGDTDTAEYYAGQAVEHQADADHYGDLGEHGGDVAVYDATSVVETGGTYDAPDVAEAAPAVDYSSSYASTDDGAE